MMKILIAGGSGLVGSNLTKKLELLGYEVSWLSRKPILNREYFLWNPSNQTIDTKCLDGVSCIINLAGAGVADHLWTNDYKKQILESRTLSTQLLVQTLKNNTNQVQTYINASATGIYGNNYIGSARENDQTGDDFLANVCKEWEAATLGIEEMEIRLLKIRFGVVLSLQAGYLNKIALPAKWGFGSYFGNGNNLVPWIHLDDLCEIILFLLKNEDLKGVYNAVAPIPETNISIAKLVLMHYHSKGILMPVPEFLLKLIAGELSSVLMANQPVSAAKIIKSGYVFRYTNAKEALLNLLKKS